MFKMGRPIKYALPEFEDYLARARVNMSRNQRRIYVRAVVKLQELVGETPTPEEIERAIGSLADKTGPGGQAAWNLFAQFMLEEKKVILPVVDHRRGSPLVVQSNIEYLDMLRVFHEYTDCTFEELINFTNKQIKRLTDKTDQNRWAFILLLPDPKRKIEVCFHRGMTAAEKRLRDAFRDSFMDLRDRRNRVKYVLNENNDQAKWEKMDREYVENIVRYARVQFRVSSVTPKLARKTTLDLSEFYETQLDLALRQYVHDPSLEWAHVQHAADLQES